MTTILVCLDGCAPEYLAAAETPALDRLGVEGRWITGRGMVPTVTNVNNASVLTGQPPSVHGITGNYYIDAGGDGVYMEAPSLLRSPLLFTEARARGLRAVMISSKRKLIDLFSGEADLAFSVETPVDWAVEALGAPPPIYSIEANLWLLRAARLTLERERPDVLYVTSTDYLGHMFPPESAEARGFFTEADRLIGELVSGAAPVSIAITADHGMNRKSRAVDLEVVLRGASIASAAVPTLKDRYVKHHNNLSGSAYVYVNAADIDRAASVLAEVSGVDRVLRREDAAAEFRLAPDRIGDLMVLGDVDTSFGTVEVPSMEVEGLRTHGSLHEVAVPIITWGPLYRDFAGEENRAISLPLLQALRESARAI